MSASEYRTWPWARREALGTLRYPRLFQHLFGYTETHKKVSAADTDAVHAAITASASATTEVDSGFTDPDVPRVISVTSGGTAADIATCTVTVTGRNVEGKEISETFAFSANTAETKTGTKAFKRVTSISIPAQDGAAATFSVGTGAALGLNHKLTSGKVTIQVFQDTAVDGSNPTAQAAPSASTVDGDEVEKNTVTPATTPDGSTFLTIVYWMHQLLIDPVHDAPEFYSTTTSTSTSSTSTSTSTSSTSTSTSSTSTSTSTSSTSTSSTSTSTTTIA